MVNLIARIADLSRRHFVLAAVALAFVCAPALSHAASVEDSDITNGPGSNDIIANAQSLGAIDATGFEVTGVIEPVFGQNNTIAGDVDLFTFTAQAGHILNAEIFDASAFAILFTPTVKVSTLDQSFTRSADVFVAPNTVPTILENLILPETTTYVLQIASDFDIAFFEYRLTMNAVAPPSVADVPLPASLPMLGGALALAFSIGRRKARGAARRTNKDERPASA